MAVNYFKKPVFISSLICIFIFYSGLFIIPDKTSPHLLLKTESIREISGTIISSPAKTGNGSYYAASFSLESAADARNFRSSASGRLKIFIPTEMAEAYSPGKLYSNSKTGFLFETGGHCSFRGRLTQSGFYIRECTGSHWPSSWRGRLAHLRALCRLHFKRLMYSWGSGGGLLLALLCGAREYTDTATQEAFRRAGLSHILALSGMHLSMFSAIAFFLGNRTGIKKFTFVLRIITLAAFVWFAGFSPSLTRAFICAMLMIISSIAGSKKPDMLSILCFSFLFQSAPFVTIFIYSGLILIILSLIFPILSKPSGIFINLQYTVINYIVKFFSLVPNWSIN